MWCSICYSQTFSQFREGSARWVRQPVFRGFQGGITAGERSETARRLTRWDAVSGRSVEPGWRINRGDRHAGPLHHLLHRRFYHLGRLLRLEVTRSDETREVVKRRDELASCPSLFVRARLRTL